MLQDRVLAVIQEATAIEKELGKLGGIPSERLSAALHELGVALMEYRDSAGYWARN